MPTVTATQIMTDFFQALNIYQPGDAFNATDTTTLLRQLNLLIGQWAQQSLTIPAETRSVFLLSTLFAGGHTGSSTAPFTVGASGDLNIPKPPNQSSVTGAGLLLNASSPPVEIPRGIMTNDGYDRERIKDLTSTLFTSVFYLPTFAGGLGELFLWPVPTDLTNSLVLYTRTGLTAFVDLTTVYSIPDGYDEALYLNLIVRAGKFFGRKPDADDRADARTSLATIKRSNVQLSDLDNDMAGIGMRSGRGWYNLSTGEGG